MEQFNPLTRTSPHSPLSPNPIMSSVPWTVTEDANRKAIKVHGFGLLALSFQTLGIIYSDIGTSPLYVLNGIWPAASPPPSAEDVIGGVSAIIWSLTLLPLLKYVGFALYFGTKEGEGGSFALFQAIYPPKKINYEDERSLTEDSKDDPSSVHRPGYAFLQRIKWPLLCWTLFGTALTLADGMLTPAVSVTSAVAGISLTVSHLSDDIQSLSIAFIVALFLIQRFGTAKISYVFSPITFVWLSLLFITGVINTTSYPGIFRAFDPSRAVLFFVRTGQYDLLAGVLLAITGCEALFANLGQFNRLSIQLSFACFTYPALILAYLGQGAKLVTDGEGVISNVFYLTIPGGAGSPLYWVMYVFAILATLVASQAMITATFSVIQQVINMKTLPPLRMRYTSEVIQGQIYIPSVNWTLCIGTIILVLIFKDLARLTYAYGFAVATVMFVTTTLITIQIPYVKRKPWILGLVWLLFFGFLDGLFWGAALRKVPHGAWIPLLVGCILCLFMTFWTWAKGNEDEFDGTNRRSLRQFLSMDISPKTRNRKLASAATPPNIDGASSGRITPADTGNNDSEEMDEKLSLYLQTTADGDKLQLARIPTCAIFHKMSAGRGVPHTFYGFLKQWPAIPRVVIFLSVKVMPINRVPIEDRYHLTKVRSIPGFYGVTYCKGFRDKFNVDIDALVKQIVALEARVDPRSSSEVIAEVEAATSNTTHIVPHYHVMSKRIVGFFGAPVVGWFRKLLIEDIYRSISYMFPETVNWLESADEIIHVGVNAEI